MSFEVAAESYDRFMGRYSTLLAPQLADLAEVEAGSSVVEVGCGPGALTGELLARGAAVAAVEPSEPFVAAARDRHPDADVRHGSAEELPFGDDEFDAGLAQLVVHFMDDPIEGLRELRRVTAPGGWVAACVWDHAGGRGPLSLFWEAAREADPSAADESDLAGARDGHLVELFRAAGLGAVEQHELTVRREHADFADWWSPYELGVGPAGAYLKTLAAEGRTAVRNRCRARLGDGPIALDAVAWAARGRA